MLRDSVWRGADDEALVDGDQRGSTMPRWRSTSPRWRVALRGWAQIVVIA